MSEFTNERLMNFMNDESYMDSDEIEEMPDDAGNDMLKMLARMQKQLTFLEKKIDMLINRGEGERKFDGARPAPKPFRKPYDRPLQRFDRPPRRSRNEGEDRERGYRDRDRDRESSREQYSERRKPGKKPGGKPRTGGFGKKPFYSRFSD
jgi:hypothetical protein